MRKAKQTTYLSQSTQGTCRAIELGLECLPSKHHFFVDVGLVSTGVVKVRRRAVI